MVIWLKTLTLAIVVGVASISLASKISLPQDPHKLSIISSLVAPWLSLNFGKLDARAIGILSAEPRVVEGYLSMTADLLTGGAPDRQRIEELVNIVDLAVGHSQQLTTDPLMLENERRLLIDVIEQRLLRKMSEERYLTHTVSEATYRRDLQKLLDDRQNDDLEQMMWLTRVVDIHNEYPQLEQRISPLLAEAMSAGAGSQQDQTAYLNNRNALVLTLDDLLAHYRIDREVIAEVKLKVLRDEKLVLIDQNSLEVVSIDNDKDVDLRIKAFELPDDLAEKFLLIRLVEGPKPNLEYLRGVKRVSGIRTTAVRIIDGDSIFPQQQLTIQHIDPESDDLITANAQIDVGRLALPEMFRGVGITWQDLLDPDLQYEPLIYNFAKKTGWEASKIDALSDAGVDKLLAAIQQKKAETSDESRRQIFEEFSENVRKLPIKTLKLDNIAKRIDDFPVAEAKNFHMGNMTRRQILQSALDTYELHNNVWRGELTIEDYANVRDLYLPSAAITQLLLEEEGYRIEKIRELYGHDVYAFIAGKAPIFSQQELDKIMDHFRSRIAQELKQRSLDERSTILLAALPRSVLFELVATSHAERIEQSIEQLDKDARYAFNHINSYIISQSRTARQRLATELAKQQRSNK